MEYTKVENRVEHSSYYIVMEHKIAVPVGNNSEETLASYLANKGDFHTIQDLDTYPTVNHNMLALHFEEFEIVPMLKKIVVSKPKAIFSGWEMQIRETQRRVAQENQTRANRLHKIQSNPFHRDSDLEGI